MLSKNFKLILFVFVLVNSFGYGISEEAKKILDNIKKQNQNEQIINSKPAVQAEVPAERQFDKFSLHTAVKNSDRLAVNRILESKAVDINLIDSNGETPMDIATKLRDVDSVYDSIRFELSLYEAKTSKEIKEITKQENFVKTGGQDFFQAIANEDLSKLNEFLNRGFIPNGKYQNESPLHFAIRLNKPKVVSLLLKFPGIDVNEKDMGGATPLDVARMYNQNAIVEMLKKAHAEGTRRVTPQSNVTGKTTSSDVGPVHVKGYYRKDGTYVRPHSRRK
ncbi:MAG: ankyrin repeat domain-containing protein [Candidatus Riflebacteria bacterium]|nr:ankyrin repeat domain-containing protein [Candidatus Riflebacteria bacterium]